MAEVEDEADALRRGPGLALIALDYAQLLADPDERTPRYLAVGNVAQRSVALAREFCVPVIIASQVNTTKEGTKTVYSFRESQILEHKGPQRSRVRRDLARVAGRPPHCGVRGLPRHEKPKRPAFRAAGGL
jgi:replicative DNA helicase